MAGNDGQQNGVDGGNAGDIAIDGINNIGDAGGSVGGTDGGTGDGNERGTTSTGGSNDPNAPRNPLEAVKRGRGRPRKDAGDGSAGKSQSAGHASHATQPKAKVLDVGVFATQIFGIHQMAAMFFKSPHFAISEDEAKKLATALKNVMQYHKININPQHVAYVQLIGVCLAVYGPRVYMVAMQKKAEKQAQENAGQM